MPTPYGSRGGVAFSADELRVLRGALAAALRSSSLSASEADDTLRLAEALDDAEREGYRLRSFIVADLARYRAALPGAVSGYLARLDEALADGLTPGAEDLSALEAVAALPAGPAEAARRTALLERCRRRAEEDARGRLQLLHGGRKPVRLAEEKPGKRPKEEPGRGPSQPRREPQRPPVQPRRPVPTPGEVFPPRRRRPSTPEEALPA